MVVPNGTLVELLYCKNIRGIVSKNIGEQGTISCYDKQRDAYLIDPLSDNGAIYARGAFKIVDSPGDWDQIKRDTGWEPSKIIERNPCNEIPIV